MTEIKDVNAPELTMYARLSENELRHYYEPDLGLFVAESALVTGRALDAGYEPVSLLLDYKQAESGAGGLLPRFEAYPELPIYTARSEILEQITGYHLARGVLCLMRRKIFPPVGPVCSGKRRIVVLEKVMNPTNLGAVFRSAAALGMEAVLLTPGCADPLYKRSARVSMGTVFQIPWTVLPDNWMDILKREGFAIASFALRNDTVSITDPALNAEVKLAVVLGSEGPGLDEETIASSDYTIRIPMAHGVDSLNVAAASAVAFWQLGNPTGRI